MSGDTRKTYVVWKGMKSRCGNPNNASYKRYGGRGIQVCAQWHTFHAFLQDMGEAPNGMTLERINNDGNYEPANCTWATREEQQRNTRRTKKYKFDGQVLTQREWEIKLGLTVGAIHHRFKRGWSVEQILSTASLGKWRDVAGERNGRSVLTEFDVIEIVKLLKNGFSQSNIGRKFGVSSATIHNIGKGKTWKHLNLSR